jgi:glutathione peroxidase
MHRYLIIAATAAVILAGLAAIKTYAKKKPSPAPLAEKSIYDFTVNDIIGNPVKLEQYRGMVLLLVNVASKCGYTYQYEGLEKLYLKNKDRGFAVLGFPANNFLSQEPGSNEEIQEFCSQKYNVTFPMFSKISVKGDGQHPLYRFLTEKETNPEFAGKISWNFNKFLVDKTGKITARYGSGAKPEDEKLLAAIERALQ